MFAARLILFVALSVCPWIAQADSYQAPWWLPGGNLQTIYAARFVAAPEVSYRRERWELSDGDFIDVDWVDGHATAPLVAMFHGLEGSARSHYASSLMAAVHARAWRGVVIHFRGCSGEPNRLPRAYHAGDVAEIDSLLRRTKMQSPDAPLYAVGVSLGGNALLKWLGEQSGEAQRVTEKAVAVSAPLDLAATGHALGNGFNLFYAQHFLSTLKQKALQKLDQYPTLYAREAVAALDTIYSFDDIVTAPLHGFNGAEDYWAKASSKAGLMHIGVPTLLINARNDPFLPETFLPSADQVSQQVTLEYPETGGHAGFVSGPFPGNLDWLPTRILEFLGDTH
ncbi:MAG: alpha/beta fold hydrolase [Pseudomonadota bacterium]